MLLSWKQQQSMKKGLYKFKCAYMMECACGPWLWIGWGRHISFLMFHWGKLLKAVWSHTSNTELMLPIKWFIYLLWAADSWKTGLISAWSGLRLIKVFILREFGKLWISVFFKNVPFPTVSKSSMLICFAILHFKFVQKWITQNLLPLISFFPLSLTLCYKKESWFRTHTLK